MRAKRKMAVRIPSSPVYNDETKRKMAVRIPSSPVYSDEGEEEDGDANGCLGDPGNDLAEVRVGVPAPDSVVFHDVHWTTAHAGDQVSERHEQDVPVTAGLDLRVDQLAS